MTDSVTDGYSDAQTKKQYATPSLIIRSGGIKNCTTCNTGSAKIIRVQSSTIDNICLSSDFKKQQQKKTSSNPGIVLRWLQHFAKQGNYCKFYYTFTTDKPETISVQISRHCSGHALTSIQSVPNSVAVAGTEPRN